MAAEGCGHFPRARVDDDALGFDGADVPVSDAHDRRSGLEKSHARSRLESQNGRFFEFFAGDRDAVLGARQVDAVHGVRGDNAVAVALAVLLHD